MPYDPNLAARVREYLSQKEAFQVEEKTMFGGLAFMVNGKMCINIGDNLLVCRFDPALTEQLSHRPGFLPMIMKEKEYLGYCYVDPIGHQRQEDLEFWINMCLDYNDKAAVAKKKPKKGWKQ